MADIDVSVIIPVYKVEEFLDRCVQSVINQTHKNIEIILVNDGSPDRCPEMCDEYAKQDSRIKVVHKQNGGLSSARNAGLSEANGNFIFFLDSDDWLDLHSIQALYDLIIEHNCDFVRYCPMYAGRKDIPDGTAYNDGKARKVAPGYYDRARIEKEIFPRLIATDKITQGAIVSACRSFYNHDFLKRNNLWFYDNVRYGEDMIFSANVVYRANSFYYLDGPNFYHYFFNSASIAKSFKPDRFDVSKKIIEYFERDFSDCTDIDYEKQLALLKMFLVLSALADRHHIENVKERESFIRKICTDPVTVDAMKHIDKADVSLKLKAMLYLIKFKMSKLLAII